MGMPLFRALVFSLLLTIAIAVGHSAPAPSHLLRIGLQTKQAAVRLQCAVPLRITFRDEIIADIPEDEIVTFSAPDAGVSVGDAFAFTLLDLSAPVLLEPLPACAATDSSGAQPFIRLLGPTRHYDKKADRPYRGAMEILFQPEGWTVVNVVDLEEYLWGVIPSEMGASYPREALKAQAVAARTYALKHVGQYAALGYDMDDTARCQVYGGVFSEDPRTSQAVTDTAGNVLTFQERLIDAVYSSTCGGISETAEAAWGNAVPYLVATTDAPCTTSPTPRPQSESEWSTFFTTTPASNCFQPHYANVEAYRWTKVMTRAEIETGLPAASQVGMLQRIIPTKRGSSGRITELTLVGSSRTVTLSKELTIRNTFGGLRSSAFTVNSYPDAEGAPSIFIFSGAGWGHGLGMCQVGAVGLALQGWDYARILAHYYPETTLESR